MSYRYLIAGLNVESDHPLPAATLQDVRWKCSPTKQPDVRIRYCNEPMLVPSECRDSRTWRHGDFADFSFQPKPGLIYRITEGSCISIYRVNDIADRDVTLFLIGSAWGILCHQRRLLPLHCSAVELDSSLFGFAGPSGIGKSTLAAGLCLRAYNHVCDDVGIVEAGAGGGALLRAMPKGLKLWRDAIEVLGLEPREAVVNDPRVEKFYVDPPRGPEQLQLRIAALYVIQFEDEIAQPRIMPLHGSAQLQRLYGTIYRVEWLKSIRKPAEILAQLRDLSERIPTFCFSRPRAMTRFDESLDVLEAHMKVVADKADLI